MAVIRWPLYTILSVIRVIFRHVRLTSIVSKAEIPLKALSPVNSPSIATNEASSIADKIDGSAFQKLSDVTSMAPAAGSRDGEDRNGHNGHKRGRLQ